MDLINLYEGSPFAKLSNHPWDWQVEQPEWMMEKLMPCSSIGMLFGPSNSGKSHFICDLIIAMLGGLPTWGGYSIKCGDVVMFSESHHHIKARMKAYRSHKNINLRHNLFTYPTMGVEQDDIYNMMIWLYTLPKAPKMIVFDTLATSFQIEENDNREASRLIKLLEEYILPAMDPQGVIVLVHHTSKASEGRTARGASALIGNIDWSINVQWDDKLQKTVARWEKDRWRLIEESPAWIGTAIRVPVEFVNGDMEMMVLDWATFTAEQEEAIKEIQADLKMSGACEKASGKLSETIKRFGKAYLRLDTKSRVPEAYKAFNVSLGSMMDKTLTEPVRDWILSKIEAPEYVFNRQEERVGFVVKEWSF